MPDDPPFHQDASWLNSKCYRVALALTCLSAGDFSHSASSSFAARTRRDRNLAGLMTRHFAMSLFAFAPLAAHLSNSDHPAACLRSRLAQVALSRSGQSRRAVVVPWSGLGAGPGRVSEHLSSILCDCSVQFRVKEPDSAVPGVRDAAITRFGRGIRVALVP
jgi:hypothetical protein